MTFEHGNENTFHLKITGMKRRWSEPKLYIPKKNGRPTVETGKRWYVYFRWRSDPEGTLDRRFTYYHDLNRLKTVRERRIKGKALRDAYRQALLRGWNPDTKEISEKKKITTIGQALDFALKLKLESVKEATATDYTFRIGIFKKWMEKESLLHLPANEINVNHIHDFIDYLQLDYRKENKKKLSKNSIDNTRRVISALFTVLQNKRVITRNFVKDIPSLKSKAKKNKPFTPSELKLIHEKLRVIDPYLIHFLSFMIYAVLRPREIVRLKVGDINRDDWLITVETKTTDFSISRIIERLKPTIDKMNLDSYPDSHNLFSYHNRPAEWNTKRLDSKVTHFSKRFTKVIRGMGFSEEYSLYSVRHTAIWMLYTGLQNQGKNDREIIQALMPITGHSSEQGLRNYLREVQVIIPPDHSDLYDVEF